MLKQEVEEANFLNSETQKDFEWQHVDISFVF